MEAVEAALDGTHILHRRRVELRFPKQEKVWDLTYFNVQYLTNMPSFWFFDFFKEMRLIK